MTDKPNGSVSMRQLAKLLKKFHLQSGDVLALKYKSSIANKETIQWLADAIGNRMGINVLVVVVDDFEEMDVLNETEMNKHGWYRMSSIAKMLKIPQKEKEQ